MISRKFLFRGGIWRDECLGLLNPEGILHQSPGLRTRELPWETGALSIQPRRGCVANPKGNARPIPDCASSVGRAVHLGNLFSYGVSPGSLYSALLVRGWIG